MSVNLSKVPANRLEKLNNRIDFSKGFAGIMDVNGDPVKSFSHNVLHVLIGQVIADNSGIDGRDQLDLKAIGQWLVNARPTLDVSGTVEPYILEILQQSANEATLPSDYKRNTLSSYWKRIESGYIFLRQRSDATGRATVSRDEIKAAVLSGHLKLKIVIPPALLASETPASNDVVLNS